MCGREDEKGGFDGEKEGRAFLPFLELIWMGEEN